MPRERSPGLKILWVWTIGTAAVLVTFVVKSRLSEMDRMLNPQQEDQGQDPTPRQHPSPGDPVILDTQPGPGDDDRA